MAQTTIITDDIDGSPDAETILFSFKTTVYEIDLGDKNQKKLAEALRPFIDNARKAISGRRAGAGAMSSGPKTDYTAEENFGVLHRGKVTPEEARLVRSNMAQAQKNRKSAGQDPIDPNDEKEKARYGL